MQLEPSEVPRFISSISKLKFLSLSFKVNDSKRVSSFYNELANTVPLNLMSLKWNNYSLNNLDFICAFLQRCSASLKHLHLRECSNTLLQTILEYLVSELTNELSLY